MSHLNLDDAWPTGAAGLPTIDARRWGPRLRFCAPADVIEEFHREVREDLGDFVLYGSGDFHHLTALWLRQVAEPVTVISFDHHPDWDRRPPGWCCGAWVNRALELPQIQKVSVWGCGSIGWQGRLFGNRRAVRDGRLALESGDLRGSFSRFAASLATESVYITIDLDCLRAEEAATNWTNGRLNVDDLVWALQLLRRSTRIVGGDLCGAYSPERYARAGQWFVGHWDHPPLRRRAPAEAAMVNQRTLAKLWPALAD